MKCENCGKEEVNFHFTSNINGNITEKHLCADCAAKLGFTEKSMKPDASFEDIFSDLFGGRPNKRMFGGYGMVFPTFIIPTVGVLVPGAGYEEEAEAEPEMLPADKPVDIKIEIDTEMQKRREINLLRQQMHRAAEADDFERAAAIRDNIKKLESGLNL